MFSARSRRSIEALGDRNLSFEGRVKVLCIALFVILLLITLQSARMGVSGLIVELAQREVDRWASTNARRGLREINRVAGYFADSLAFTPSNPWALEGLGGLDLAMVRLARMPRDAVASTREARLRFRRALQQRPTSPFLWANIARSKLLLDEIDDELFRALRIADELGPWEPSAQRNVLFVGLATWEKLDAGLQKSLRGVIGRGGRHDAPKMYEIVKSYRRFDLVCGVQEYNFIAGPDCRRLESGVGSGQRVTKGNR